MTRCGHTFCYECIIKCFETSSRCPKCNFDLENRENDIYPNFLLNELVAKHKSKLDKVARANSGSNPRNEEILSTILDPSSTMTLSQCEQAIRALSDRKDEILNQSLLVEYRLLKEFLTQLKRIKDDELIRLKRETSVIQDDLNLVESLVENVQQMKIEVDPDDPKGKVICYFYSGVQ